jgi:hypothetical protein
MVDLRGWNMWDIFYPISEASVYYISYLVAFIPSLSAGAAEPNAQELPMRLYFNHKWCPITNSTHSPGIGLFGMNERTL